MSTTTNPHTEERDAQLLSVGAQCSAPSCNLVDFLPFKCQHCGHKYCADHFTVDGHKCPDYDESKHNRVAPDCPFCNEPVAIRVGQDPNDRLEEHFAKECTVMTGRSKTKSVPTCASKKCSKVLFAPIRCDKCRQQFCPSHRFPADHACNAATSSTARPTKSTPMKQPNINEINAKFNNASGAIKKAVASAAASIPSSNNSQSTTSKPVPPRTAPATTSSASSHHNPFSKTDRTPISSPLIQPVSPTPTVDAPVVNLPVKTRADPIIDPMSFVPRSIFGRA